jgi:hypothetical protein
VVLVTVRNVILQMSGAVMSTMTPYLNRKEAAAEAGTLATDRPEQLDSIAPTLGRPRRQGR